MSNEVTRYKVALAAMTDQRDYHMERARKAHQRANNLRDNNARLLAELARGCEDLDAHDDHAEHLCAPAGRLGDEGFRGRNLYWPVVVFDSTDPEIEAAVRADRA
jgi:hypothetical protein